MPFLQLAHRPLVLDLQSKAMLRLKGRLSSSPHAIKRLLKGDITQRFGRFLIIRKLYSFLQNLQQRFNPAFGEENLNLERQSLFGDLCISKLVQEVDQNAVAFGLSLPEAMVEEILRYASCTLCVEPGYDRAFRIDEIDRNGYLPDGHHVIRALVNDPDRCPAIASVAQDPRLLQIARAYLHYYPTQVTCHLTWSIASDLPEEELKKRYPPTNFHYDIAGYNFATAYFYITPVLDPGSGPHVMIKGSHKRKPLWMLLRSGRYSDEVMYRFYGRENEIQIQGDAGFGFFQDPSCCHRVKAPTHQNRLLLQIRYS